MAKYTPSINCGISSHPRGLETRALRAGVEIEPANQWEEAALEKLVAADKATKARGPGRPRKEAPETKDAGPAPENKAAGESE